jgi:2'-5' RNA ligase
MEEKFIKINIAIKSPEKVAEKAIEESRKIGNNYKALFVLDGVNYYPHITIYSIEYPEENLGNIFQALEKLLPELEKIKLVFTDVKRNQNYVGVHFTPSQEVRNFHKKIIEKINPLRGGKIRDKFMELSQVADLPEEKKENILKYGHPDVMNSYEPHITISRLENDDMAEKAEKEIKWEISEFVADKIAVCRSGKNGTCVEILKEFSFGK